MARKRARDTSSAAQKYLMYLRPEGRKLCDGDKNFLSFKNHLCHRLFRRVRNADRDILHTQPVCNLARFAPQLEHRPAPLPPQNLDVHPTHAAAPARPQRLHGGFFHRKPPGVPLILIPELLAVRAFPLGKNSLQKSFALALNRAFHPLHFFHINSHSNDHAVPVTTGRSKCQVEISDYTESMPTAVKTSRARRLPGKTVPRSLKRPKVSSPWSLRSVGGMQILELVPFKKLPWLVHGFSTRAGGSSILDSGERVLNLGFTDWDAREKVLKNRQSFQSALGARPSTLIPLKQIHSAVARFFAAPPAVSSKGLPAETAGPAQVGDASFTNARGLLLGVQTADCVPILLVDPKKRAVAAIHAGWRGTLARIALKTVGHMRMRFGSNPADILAALGPAIGGCCYEVGTELVTKFTSQFADAEEYFDELRTGEEPNPLQWLNMMPPGHQPASKNVRLDLRKANRAQLLAAGLGDTNIFASDLCTACHTGLLFSYRKEAHSSGRLLSAIGLRP